MRLAALVHSNTSAAESMLPRHQQSSLRQQFISESVAGNRLRAVSRLLAGEPNPLPPSRRSASLKDLPAFILALKASYSNLVDIDAIADRSTLVLFVC